MKVLRYRCGYVKLKFSVLGRGSLVMESKCLRRMYEMIGMDRVENEQERYRVLVREIKSNRVDRKILEWMEPSDVRGV